MQEDEEPSYLEGVNVAPDFIDEAPIEVGISVKNSIMLTPIARHQAPKDAQRAAVTGS